MTLRLKKWFAHPSKAIESKAISICFAADNDVNVHN
jgi:hypothetical protein